MHDLQVNFVDQNKRLPLHYAAATGNVTILSTLADVRPLNEIVIVAARMPRLVRMSTIRWRTSMGSVRCTTLSFEVSGRAGCARIGRWA